jgi:hypothetical protein
VTALPPQVIAELREHQEFEAEFRDGLELGSDTRALARALDLAGYAMLRASRALRAAAPTPATKGTTP